MAGSATAGFVALAAASMAEQLAFNAWRADVTLSPRDDTLDQPTAEKHMMQSGVRASTADMEEYVEDCTRAGVPYPPPLGSADWKGPFSLSKDVPSYFIMRDMVQSRYYTYVAGPWSAQPGFCFNLVRSRSAGLDEPTEIGTICTNSTQTKACTYDFYVYDPASPGGKAMLSVRQAMATEHRDLVHPADAGEVCQDCHIGQNAFVAHPDLELGAALQKLYAHMECINAGLPLDCGVKPAATPPGLRPHVSFVPFRGELSRYFVDNPPPALPVSTGPGGDGACMQCHNLPAMAKPVRAYCDTILATAAEETMPPRNASARGNAPGGKVGWPGLGRVHEADSSQQVAHQEYFASIRQLYRACLG